MGNMRSRKAAENDCIERSSNWAGEVSRGSRSPRSSRRPPASWKQRDLSDVESKGSRLRGRALATAADRGGRGGPVAVRRPCCPIPGEVATRDDLMIGVLRSAFACRASPIWFGTPRRLLVWHRMTCKQTKDLAGGQDRPACTSAARPGPKPWRSWILRCALPFLIRRRRKPVWRSHAIVPDEVSLRFSLPHRLWNFPPVVARLMLIGMLALFALKGARTERPSRPVSSRARRPRGFRARTPPPLS